MPRLSGTLLFDPIFASFSDVYRAALPSARLHLFRSLFLLFFSIFLYQTHGCYTHFLAIGLDLGGNKNSARRDGKKEDAIPPRKSLWFSFLVSWALFLRLCWISCYIMRIVSVVLLVSQTKTGVRQLHSRRYIYTRLAGNREAKQFHLLHIHSLLSDNRDVTGILRRGIIAGSTYDLQRGWDTPVVRREGPKVEHTGPTPWASRRKGRKMMRIVGWAWSAEAVEKSLAW